MNNKNKTQNALLEAINIMIENKIKKIKFNYYVDGVIIDRNDNNTYTVKINNNEYKNIPSKNQLIYAPNDTVQILIKNGDWNKKFIDGVAHHTKHMLDHMHPVGSVYMTSTNVNPSNTIGGSWELIDKEFISIYGELTPEKTNNASSCTAHYSRQGHAIYIRIKFTNAIELADNTVDICTLDIAQLGVNNLTYSKYNIGQSDGGNGVFMATLSHLGVLQVLDVIGRGTAITIGQSHDCWVEFINEIPSTNMLDSACDKFYWKRTA